MFSFFREGMEKNVDSEQKCSSHKIFFSENEGKKNGRKRERERALLFFFFLVVATRKQRNMESRPARTSRIPRLNNPAGALAVRSVREQRLKKLNLSLFFFLANNDDANARFFFQFRLQFSRSLYALSSVLHFNSKYRTRPTSPRMTLELLLRLRQEESAGARRRARKWRGRPSAPPRRRRRRQRRRRRHRRRRQSRLNSNNNNNLLLLLRPRP